MTDQELDLMERLWKRGVSAARIAACLNYSTSAVVVTAMRHRDRFPMRRGRSTDSETRKFWILKIKSGEVTAEQVANELGLKRHTVMRWVSESNT